MTLTQNVQRITTRTGSQLVTNLQWKSIPFQQTLPLPWKLPKQHSKTGLQLQNTTALGYQHTLHACTLCPGTISQPGQGDAAKLPSMQQPRIEVSQQSQSHPGEEGGLPFHLQYAASTHADSTLDAQEHTKRFLAPIKALRKQRT